MIVRYMNSSFSVNVGGKDYAKGWEETFGKKAASEHIDHGRGGPDGPEDSDCPCRQTGEQRECAETGCGFCRAASATDGGSAAERQASGCDLTEEEIEAEIQAVRGWRRLTGPAIIEAAYEAKRAVRCAVTPSADIPTWKHASEECRAQVMKDAEAWVAKSHGDQANILDVLAPQDLAFVAVVDALWHRTKDPTGRAVVPGGAP